MIDTKEIRKALAIHGVDVLNEDEVLDVLDHLEAAEKEIESWKGLARQFGNEADELRTHLSFAKDELNRLRAKNAGLVDDMNLLRDNNTALRARIEAMERQEPVKTQHRVPFVNSNGELVGYSVWIEGRGFDHWPHRSLYLAPGAQPAPSVPEGWPTEEMTAAFARVFNVRDQYGTFPQAFRAALAAAPEPKL